HVDGVAHQGEPRQPIDRFVGRDGVEKVDPAVVGEVVVDGQPGQPVRGAGGRQVEFQVAGQGGRRLVAVLVDELDLAGALDVEHSAVGQRGQLVRVGEVGVVFELDLGEAVPLGGGAVARCDAGRPLDTAENVLEEQRLGKRLAVVAACGVPR